MTQYPAHDAVGEALRQNYEQLLETIKRNLDPTNNAVLIVDDERPIRLKVARDVRSFDRNAAIYEAGNGKEALEQLDQIRKKYKRDPLFIVLDLQMPIMDGWEVIRKLKEDYESKGRPAGIPIIVLSSTSGEMTIALIMKKSVHGGKSGYTPLVTIAKDVCVDKTRYDVAGEKGLVAWLEYFVKQSNSSTARPPYADRRAVLSARRAPCRRPRRPGSSFPARQGREYPASKPLHRRPLRHMAPHRTWRQSPPCSLR